MSSVSRMTMRPRLLAAVTLGLAFVVGLGLAGLPVGPLRVAAGIPLALWLPGAALLLAARPRWRLSATSAAAVLAVPLSLAVLALVGVILDATSVGLRPVPLGIGAVAPTLLLLLVAELRAR